MHPTCYIAGYISRTASGKVGTSVREIMMTREGIDYVETKLSIDQRASGPEKIDSVAKTAAKFGWEQIKDIIAIIVAETIKI